MFRSVFCPVFWPVFWPLFCPSVCACAAAAGLATAAGFVVMIAPGGLGVRELVLIEALRLLPGVSPPQAAAATFLMRAVTLVAEVAVAAALYYGLRPAPPDAPER